MTFHPVTLDEYDRVYAYMSVYGENSCQHSFVTLYSLTEKYGDEICEQEGFLYTHRSQLDDKKYRVYLAPMGGGDLAAAYEKIRDDAHCYGKKAKFHTLTKRHADFVREHFGNQFDFTEVRDLFEYLYRSEAFATYTGPNLKKRRKEVAQFWRIYGERAEISRIDEKSLPDVLDYAREWLDKNAQTRDRHALEIEFRLIEKQVAHFDDLHLSGVILRVDGKVVGFSYGTPLSDSCFDIIIEKANAEYSKAYQVVRQESGKQAANVYPYSNLEEDVGVPGLRKLKTLYRPEYLLEKTVVAER